MNKIPFILRFIGLILIALIIKAVKNFKGIFLVYIDLLKMGLKNFDEFVQGLQDEIDRKDQTDFSEYAIQLSHDLKHIGKIDAAKNVLIHEWQGPCGDSVKWFLQIDSEHVSKARFQTNGCITADMASEQTARMIEHKSLAEIRQLTNQEILDALQKFPPESHHCVELALHSLNLTLDTIVKNSEK